MADRQDTYSAIFDTSQSVQAANALTAALRDQRNAIGELAKASGKFGTAGTTMYKSLQNLATAQARFTQNTQVNAGTMAQTANAAQNLSAQQVQLAKTTAQASSQMNQMAKVGKQAGQTVLLSWQSVFRLFAIRALQSIFTTFTQGLKESTTEALELGKAIAEIQTISPGAGGRPIISFEGLADQAGEISRQFNLDRADILEAQYEAISNQINGAARSMDFLQDAAGLAKAAVSSLGDSVDSLSSIINAFNLSTEDAESIAAKLFKTVDLGRVRLSELSNDIGRSAVLADSLGVSLDELLAAFTTITIQGVKFNNAQTLTVNIMNKLIRPTDAMRAIFDKLGVSSGKALVETYGFAQAMQLIADEAASSGDALDGLGEAFGRIRAITGANILGQNAELFSESIGKIRDSLEQYEYAQQTVLQSQSEVVSREFNEVKQELIDFGFAIVSAFNTIDNSIVDISTTITVIMKALATALTLAVAGWGAYKVAVNAAAIVTARQAAVTAAATAACNLYTGAATRAAVATTGATAGLNLLVGALAVAAASFAGFIAFKTFSKDAEETFEKYYRDFKEANDRLVEDARQGAQKIVEALDIALGDALQDQLQEVADVLVDVNDDIENSKTAIDAFATAFKYAQKQAEEDSNELRRQYRLFKDDLDKSKDSIQKVGETFKKVTDKAIQELIKLDRQLTDTLSQDRSSAFDRFVDTLSNPLDQLGAYLNEADFRRGKAIEFFNVGNMEDGTAQLEESNRLLEQGRAIAKEFYEENRRGLIKRYGVPNAFDFEGLFSQNAALQEQALSAAAQVQFDEVVGAYNQQGDELANVLTNIFNQANISEGLYARAGILLEDIYILQRAINTGQVDHVTGAQEVNRIYEESLAVLEAYDSEMQTFNKNLENQQEAQKELFSQTVTAFENIRQSIKDAAAGETSIDVEIASIEVLADLEQNLTSIFDDPNIDATGLLLSSLDQQIATRESVIAFLEEKARSLAPDDPEVELTTQRLQEAIQERDVLARQEAEVASGRLGTEEIIQRLVQQSLDATREKIALEEEQQRILQDRQAILDNIRVIEQKTRENQFTNTVDLTSSLEAVASTLRETQAITSSGFGPSGAVLTTEFTDEVKTLISTITTLTQQFKDGFIDTDTFVQRAGAIGQQVQENPELAAQLDEALGAKFQNLLDLTEQIEFNNQAVDNAFDNLSQFGDVIVKETGYSLEQLQSAIAGGDTSVISKFYDLQTAQDVLKNSALDTATAFQRLQAVIANIRPQGQATGGIVTGQGKAPFKIGTDSVLRMLTPGEYVVRKSVVDTLGRGFFDSLNYGIKGRSFVGYKPESVGQATSFSKNENHFHIQSTGNETIDARRLSNKIDSINRRKVAGICF